MADEKKPNSQKTLKVGFWGDLRRFLRNPIRRLVGHLFLPQMLFKAARQNKKPEDVSQDGKVQKNAGSWFISVNWLFAFKGIPTLDDVF